MSLSFLSVARAFCYEYDMIVSHSAQPDVQASGFAVLKHHLLATNLDFSRRLP